MDVEQYAQQNENDLDIFQSLVSVNKIESNPNTEQDEKVGYDARLNPVKIYFTTGKSDQFEGACVDSGAHLTVIGKRQSEKFCELMNEHVITNGKSRHSSLGTTVISDPKLSVFA